MRKYVLLAITINSMLIAMNNNDPRPVRFESKEILYYRLLAHDEKNNTTYASFALQHKLHEHLGNSIRTREEVSTVIKFALKKTDPNMSEAEVIEHKRTIINCLRPELHESKL